MPEAESVEDAFDLVADAARKWALLMLEMRDRNQKYAVDAEAYGRALQRAIEQVKHEVWGT